MGALVKPFDQVINKSVVINATPAIVWQALTNPVLLKQWMTETAIDVITDWKTGSPIIIKGYAGSFENRGLILKFKPFENLSYSHLSSLSKLADDAASYTVIEFQLRPTEDQTTLSLTLSNFPSESIYRHINYYWSVTLEVLKNFVEQSLFNSMVALYCQ